MARKSHTVVRSAKTGRFVNKGRAKSDPSHTVTERVPNRGKKK